MSLHFLIDGYNVIKQEYTFANMNLSEARDAFLRFLSCNDFAGSRNNKITVVFDGREGVFSPPGSLAKFQGIGVVFSKDETADDRIIRILGDSSNPKDTVMVSDDRLLRSSARAFGAQLMSVRDFLKKTDKSANKSRKIETQSTIKLTILEERSITEELKKIWLKEKG